MGSGSDTSSSQQTVPTIPKWLKPLLVGEERQYEQGQDKLPSIAQLFGMVPQQGTAPFTAQQNALISQISGLNGQLNPAEQAAQGQYNQFLSQNGPSAATQQEEQNFSQLQAPQILQQAALMGQGNSGAALSALSQGQETALVPFLQQDTQNKLTAAGDLQGLGTQQYNQQTQDLQNALVAAGMPQQLAQQQADALFQQLEQQFQYAQGIQTQPFGLFGNAIGGGSSTSINTPSKF
jgi:hypothetical protein